MYAAGCALTNAATDLAAGLLSSHAQFQIGYMLSRCFQEND